MSQTGAQGLDALTALQAASTRHVTLPGRDVAAGIVADTATRILALDDRLKHTGRQIRQTFRPRPRARIIESLPGTGPIMGAESIGAAGYLGTYADEGRLASAAGLVPVPRDSGRRTGNLHRPKRYNRRLRRVLHPSAQTRIIREGPNRDPYAKKRSEGCRHVQAVTALARRRVDVLWAPCATTDPSLSVHPSPGLLERASAPRLPGDSLRATPERRVQWATTRNAQRVSLPCRKPSGPSGRQPATRSSLHRPP